MISQALVIGGGVAGLTAAAELAAGGRGVRVLDKARGPGGRTSVRRVDDPGLGPMRFPHGCTHLAGDDAGLAESLEAWRRAGLVRRWDGRAAGAADVPRFVGVPAMNAVCKALAATPGVEYVPRRRATWARFDGGRWRIEFEQGEAEEAESLVIACPAPQAAELLGPGDGIGRWAAAVRMRPVWAVLLGFAPGREPAGLAALDATATGDPRVKWLFRGEADRPGVAAWVLHLSYGLSESVLERDADAVAEAGVEVLADALGEPVDPAYAAAHRWRFAGTDVPAGEAVLVDAGRRLACCGDWCLGDGVGDTLASGRAAAGALLSALVTA